MSVLSIKKLKQLNRTIGKSKYKRLVNDRILYLKHQYSKPYPPDVQSELDELTSMYLNAKDKSITTPAKSNSKKLSYIDKQKIKNIYNHK